MQYLSSFFNHGFFHVPPSRVWCRDAPRRFSLSQTPTLCRREFWRLLALAELSDERRAGFEGEVVSVVQEAGSVLPGDGALFSLVCRSLRLHQWETDVYDDGKNEPGDYCVHCEVHSDSTFLFFLTILRRFLRLGAP